MRPTCAGELIPLCTETDEQTDEQQIGPGEINVVMAATRAH